LLNFAKRPKNYGFGFSLKMINVFEFGILLYAIGYITFYKIIADNANTVGIILIVIAIIDWLFIDIHFFDRLFQGKKDVDSTTYDE